jgi:hypothetical protein
MTSASPYRSLVAALLAGLFVSLLPIAPASAEQIVDRGFEEEAWNQPSTEAAEVGEELGLVDLRGHDLSRTTPNQGFAGLGLDITIPTGAFRGFGPFDRLGQPDNPDVAPTEVWFRYHVRLVNWNAASTGKLPGLAGIYSSSGRGCIKPSDTQRGWSARGMFGPPGTNGAPGGRVPIGTYLYHADQAGDCGDGLWWNASLEQGRWHCVEGRVKMNTPGQNDGLLRGWLDGDLALSRSNIQYRLADEPGIGVRHMWHNVYFGGSWPTPNPLSLEYDQVAVSTSGRVGCMAPFTDISQTMHAHSIRELHALGLLYGCDYRLACPSRLLSRGEAAALISRILELPSSSTDHFQDDQGSTFEQVINRLGDAGIARGCNPPANTLYCPEQTMTRAQFAAMLTRALHLAGSSVNTFSDDNGHWAEGDINAFAAAGLTSGCGSSRFCPDDPLPRDEAAAFFQRSLGLLQPLTQASDPAPVDWPPEGPPPPKPPGEED